MRVFGEGEGGGREGEGVEESLTLFYNQFHCFCILYNQQLILAICV